MFGRLDITPFVRVLGAIRKEIVLVFLVLALILAGSFENSNPAYVQEIRQTREVRKEKTHKKSKLDHLREVEVVHAKAPAVLGVKEDSNPGAQVSAVFSPQSIVSALVSYRSKKGVGALATDPKLTSFARDRAQYFSLRGGMDSHAGFQDFINNQDGFSRLGFMSLGENSSYGYSLSAVDLVEQAFAGHGPHDTNQLDPQWTHVGVGISGQAVDIVFGGKKL